MVTERRSPRTLKEYEAEVLVCQLKVDDSRASESTKRRGSTIDDCDHLPRKLFHPPRGSSKASSVQDPPAFGLEIVSPTQARMQSLVSDILEGFKARVGPVAVDDGASGVYFLRTKAQRIAGVFKPADEEPFAVNNPKAHRPRRNSRAECSNNSDDSASLKSALGIRSGIAPGGAVSREVAAYLLDHDHRAGVPPTALVSAQHPSFFVRSKAANAAPQKLGSLQLYVPHDCTADDVSESLIPVERVHELAMLDIRLANQDRHGGNVLVVGSRESGHLDIVPIDHGACLPRITSMEETSFLWLSWPQAAIPFNAEAKAYIVSLDAIRDAEELALKLPATHQVEPAALYTLVVCTLLLQVCVLEFDMTAYDTALLMCRQDPDEPSVLEQIISSRLPADKLASTWSKPDAENLMQAFRKGLTAFLTD